MGTNVSARPKHSNTDLFGNPIPSNDSLDSESTRPTPKPKPQTLQIKSAVKSIQRRFSVRIDDDAINDCIRNQVPTNQLIRDQSGLTQRYNSINPQNGLQRPFSALLLPGASCESMDGDSPGTRWQERLSKLDDITDSLNLSRSDQAEYLDLLMECIDRIDTDRLDNRLVKAQELFTKLGIKAEQTTDDEKVQGSIKAMSQHIQFLDRYILSQRIINVALSERLEKALYQLDQVRLALTTQKRDESVHHLEEKVKAQECQIKDLEISLRHHLSQPPDSNETISRNQDLFKMRAYEHDLMKRIDKLSTMDKLSALDRPVASIYADLAIDLPVESLRPSERISVLLEHLDATKDGLLSSESLLENPNLFRSRVQHYHVKDVEILSRQHALALIKLGDVLSDATQGLLNVDNVFSSYPFQFSRRFPNEDNPHQSSTSSPFEKTESNGQRGFNGSGGATTPEPAINEPDHQRITLPVSIQTQELSLSIKGVDRTKMRRRHPRSSHSNRNGETGHEDKLLNSSSYRSKQMTIKNDEYISSRTQGHRVTSREGGTHGRRHDSKSRVLNVAERSRDGVTHAVSSLRTKNSERNRMRAGLSEKQASEGSGSKAMLLDDGDSVTTPGLSQSVMRSRGRANSERHTELNGATPNGSVFDTLMKSTHTRTSRPTRNSSGRSSPRRSSKGSNRREARSSRNSDLESKKEI